MPRTCYRAEGIYSLEEQVTLPERCWSYCLQQWVTHFFGRAADYETGTLFHDLFDLQVAESVALNITLEA